MTDPMTCFFLPGIIQPAVLRYQPLLGELDASVVARTKELEVYTVTPPPGDYAIDDEVAGILACAGRLGLRRFHLYGHSGGGAAALAFTAVHPELVQSLCVDEPAFDFTAAGRAELEPYLQLAPRLMEERERALSAFIALELAPGAAPTPPAGLAPLPNRAAGVAALLDTFTRHRVDPDAFRGFEGPVLLTRGTGSAERFEASSRRLSRLFPRYREVVFEGLSHVNTSHQAEPARVAALLRELWGDAPP